MPITLIQILNVSLLFLLAGTIALLVRQASRFSLGKLHQDRRGVSYSLTMVITLPFYVAMVLGGIELTGLFYSDINFQRAVLMAGRSVAVNYQQEFENNELDRSKAKQSVEQIGELAAAAVLFSVGSGIEDHETTLANEETAFVSELLLHLESTTKFKPNEDTKRRANYAAGATAVEFKLLESESTPGQNTTNPDKAVVKVTYEHPFFSQAVGRAFGQPSLVANGFYVWKLEKEIEISLEIARSKDGTVGVKQQKQNP